jgi:two-component system chemotaxis response regulator CheY
MHLTQIPRRRMTELVPSMPTLRARGTRELRRSSPMRRHALQERQPSRLVRRVLIVDSYRDEGEMYAEYLRSTGAFVEYVATPEEALPRVRSQPPAVIVADMVFHGSNYDGPAFVHEVRALSTCATTNCIIVSGFPRASDRERARAAGADLFLVKPCPLDELRWHIARAVAAYERHTRAQWNWSD